MGKECNITETTVIHETKRLFRNQFRNDQADNTVRFSAIFRYSYTNNAKFTDDDDVFGTGRHIFDADRRWASARRLRQHVRPQ